MCVFQRRDADDLTAILTRCEGRAVLDVGGLPEGTVGAADVVVVAADDDRGADLAAGHGVVEGARDGRATLLVGVEDPRLGTRLPDGKILSLPFLGLHQGGGQGRNPRKGRDQILSSGNLACGRAITYWIQLQESF